MTISRRALIGAGGAAGLAALGASQRLLPSSAFGAAASSYPGPSVLPDPAASGIEHIVVVMMENRSFDHLLGWLPGADGKQAGLTFTDRYGVRHATHHMTAFNTCGFNDPDHSYEGGRIQYDDGACDGFLKSGLNDEAAIGYYLQDDLPFLGRAAVDWTTCDRYFSAVMAETYPNRFYMHAAQTDRLHNSTAKSTLPTIWDRLADAGVKGTYFYNDVPFTLLWYEKYLAITQPYGMFLAAATNGTLPAVSFVDPRFEDEASGTSNDDHPHADLRAGEYFLNEVYHAVTTGPQWETTMLIITFDEWGGFYDHVPPTTAPDVSPTTALRGFRVPTIVVSPKARRGYVAHEVYDHTSILKLIEWRWGLPALTPRDAAARNLAEVLDFASAPTTSAPAYQVSNYLAPGCTVESLGEAGENDQGSEYAEWPALKDLATKLGVTL